MKKKRDKNKIIKRKNIEKLASSVIGTSTLCVYLFCCVCVLFVARDYCTFGILYSTHLLLLIAELGRKS